MAEFHVSELQKQSKFVDLQKYGYKPLEIEDKDTFNKKLTHISPIISEFTFTNLWMWRDYYQFAWKQLEDTSIILVSLHDPTKLIAFPVIGDDYDQVIPELEQFKVGLNLPVEIHRVPELDVKKIQSKYSDAKIFEDRDDWDYVYKRENLVNLSGGSYETIRRKLNKFNKEYPIRLESLTPKNAHLCLELQEEWCNLRSCSDTPSLENEDKAIRDILLNIEKLNIVGFLVFHNDRLIGYSIGEPLNSNTFVIHVEKGNTDYFGLYQVLNQIFAEKYAVGFEYINREQDLGIEGLRRSKESYHPSKYVKKYIVQLN